MKTDKQFIDEIYKKYALNNIGGYNEYFEIRTKKYKIYTPIAQEVKFILDGKNPKDSLKDLLKN